MAKFSDTRGIKIMELNIGDRIKAKIRHRSDSVEEHKKGFEGVVKFVHERYITIQTDKGYTRTINLYELITGEAKIEVNGVKVKFVPNKPIHVQERTIEHSRRKKVPFTREWLLNWCIKNGTSVKAINELVGLTGVATGTIRNKLSIWGISNAVKEIKGNGKV